MPDKLYLDYLQHYGVKGMKWGVRRTAAQLGHKVVKTAKESANKVEKAHVKREAKRGLVSNSYEQLAKHSKHMTAKQINEASKRIEAKKVIQDKASKERLSRAADKVANGASHKSPKKMSTEELQANINRLNLEKQYRDLQSQTSSKGRSIVEQSAQNAAKTVLTKAMVKGAEMALTAAGFGALVGTSKKVSKVAKAAMKADEADSEEKESAKSTEESAKEQKPKSEDSKKTKRKLLPAAHSAIDVKDVDNIISNVASKHLSLI